MAAAETEKLRDDNVRLAELRAELEQRLATASQRAASLERELADTKEQHSSESKLELQLADESRRVAGLEAELAARDAAIEEFKVVADSWQTALAERDAVIAELLAARDDALEKLRASEAERAESVAAQDEAIALSQTMSTDPWAAADRHLLFFQGPGGYELVERDGPPPAPGAQVRLENGVQVVGRVAASPTPGPRVACAYLVAA